jgi:hypothetical protein
MPARDGRDDGSPEQGRGIAPDELVVADLLAAILLVGFDLRADARFQPH